VSWNGRGLSGRDAAQGISSGTYHLSDRRLRLSHHRIQARTLIEKRTDFPVGELLVVTAITPPSPFSPRFVWIYRRHICPLAHSAAPRPIVAAVQQVFHPGIHRQWGARVVSIAAALG